MATALDMIKRARRLLGALAVGETLEAELANDGLEALNAMLESWSIDSLMVLAIQSNTFTLTTAQTYTIGAGGVFNMERPDRIESAIASIGGVDYALEIIDTERWNEIAYKDVGGIPTYLKYDASVPLGLVSIYPKSNGYTLTLNTFKPIQRFTILTDVLVLQRGFELAIAANLALHLAPEASKPVSQELMLMATSSKAAIKSINAEMPILRSDPFFSRNRGGYNEGLYR